MVPPKSDPCWERFVTSSELPRLSCLATRIMYGQARLLAKKDLQAAVTIAHEFFSRNQVLAAEDLRTIIKGLE